MKMLNDLHRQTVALICRLHRAAPAGKASVRSQSVGERIRGRLRPSDEGSNIVEFALILPPLMILLTGILSFGSAMMNYESLTNGVAQGAQALVTSRTVTTNPCADTLAAISAAAPVLNSAKINLSLTMSGTPVNLNSCPGDQSLLVQGGSVTVSATYPCNIGVYGVTISPGCLLSATVTEYEF